VQGDGLMLAGGGAFLGVVAAVAGAHVFSNPVYGISVHDPISLMASPELVLLAAFVAAAIPGNACRAGQSGRRVT